MDTIASTEADKDFLKSFSGAGAENIVFDLEGVTYVASGSKTISAIGNHYFSLCN